MFSSHLRRMLLAAAITLTPAAAGAQVVNEVGDAGQLLATAQVITGSVTTINGTLDSAIDTDLYRISLVNPGGFSVSVYSDMALPDGPVPDHEDDTALFLFDAGGFLVGFSDDQTVNGYSFTPKFNVGDFAGLAAGDYYLAFNNFFRQPTVESDPFFLPGIGEGPLTGWTGQPNVPRSGAYILSLTGVGMGAAIDNGPPRPIGGIPEPATWAMMILGFGATGSVLRRGRVSATA